MRYAGKAVSVFVFITTIFYTANAQDNKIKRLVDSQSYVFQAQSASPLSGMLRQLSYGYDLSISKGKIVAYLPYFGRAYGTSYDLNDGGIKFTSTDFEYHVAQEKKSGWEVTIKPKDVNSIQSIVLSFFDNGTASLTIIPTSKDAISFNGYIEAVKPKLNKVKTR